jgi:hypothetical protein
MGQVEGKPASRQQMRDIMVGVVGDALGPFHYQETGRYRESLALARTGAKAAVLTDTVFVLCPRGNWNMESTRMSESLEHGAIPILEKGWGDETEGQPDYYRSRCWQMENHPAPTVERWQDAPALMEELLDDPEALDALQQRIIEWWARYKIGLADEFQRLMLGWPIPMPMPT